VRVQSRPGWHADADLDRDGSLSNAPSNTHLPLIQSISSHVVELADRNSTLRFISAKDLAS